MYFNDFLDHIFTHNCFGKDLLRFFKSCSCCSLYAGNKLSLVIFGSSEQLNTLLLEKQALMAGEGGAQP